MCVAAVLTASCLGDDDSSDVTYYGDTAITAFSLGTLNRHLTMKATSTFDDEGNPVDSAYTTTVTGSDYDFYIDQLNNEIYNPDSLPTNTDTTRVICSVSSKNSGVVIINYTSQENTDSLAYYSSSDSVDFSKVREFRVYANDGTAYRKYSVKINVHKEEADSFTWKSPVSVEKLKNVTGMKAVCFDGKMWLFASDGTQTHAYTAELNAPDAWEDVSLNVTLDANAYADVVSDGQSLYTLSNGTLMLSADGKSWNDAARLNGVGDNNVALSDLTHLVGADSRYVYALTTDGIAYAKPSMIWMWTKDEGFSGDASTLPTQDVTSGVLALKTNKNTERIIMVGNRRDTVFQTDTVAVVWSKIEENDDNSDAHKWMCCNDENVYQLPRLTGLTAVSYGEALVALGGKGMDGSSTPAFKQLYVSLDNGLTWQKNSSYPLPNGFTNGDSDVFAMAMDTDNYLWIVCGGTGAVWRGRLNNLGWTSEKKSFTE